MQVIRVHVSIVEEGETAQSWSTTVTEWKTAKNTTSPIFLCNDARMSQEPGASHDVGTHLDRTSARRDATRHGEGRYEPSQSNAARGSKRVARRQQYSGTCIVRVRSIVVYTETLWTG